MSYYRREDDDEYTPVPPPDAFIEQANQVVQASADATAQLTGMVATVIEQLQGTVTDARDFYLKLADLQHRQTAAIIESQASWLEMMATEHAAYQTAAMERIVQLEDEKAAGQFTGKPGTPTAPDLSSIMQLLGGFINPGQGDAAEEARRVLALLEKVEAVADDKGHEHPDRIPPEFLDQARSAKTSDDVDAIAERLFQWLAGHPKQAKDYQSCLSPQDQVLLTLIFNRVSKS